jgi:hypothetical protein
MARNDPQFKLRLPEPMRDRIRASAEASRRTLNSEIIVLLERALPADKNQKAETVGAVPAE